MASVEQGVVADISGKVLGPGFPIKPNIFERKNAPKQRGRKNEF
jgi:hypothetical protein